MLKIRQTLRLDPATDNLRGAVAEYKQPDGKYTGQFKVDSDRPDADGNVFGVMLDYSSGDGRGEWLPMCDLSAFRATTVNGVRQC